MNWGTVESMWSLHTLEGGDESTIRYGAVLGWRTDWLARIPATPCEAGENHPDRNCRAMAAKNALGLAEKACDMVP